jgi:RNA polymerase sigma factor (sigma-70 family)
VSLSLPSDDLAALLARVHDGDETALTRLLLHYEPRLRTAVHVLLGPLLRPRFDSLDLIQSVHRVLLHGLRNGNYDLSDPENIISLAITVARRKVARNWRRLQLEQAHLEALRGAGTAPHSLSDPAAIAQFRDSIRQMLVQLRDDDRRLFELRLEGHSTPEIASLLNCDAHALRARLARLRQRNRSRHSDSSFVNRPLRVG